MSEGSYHQSVTLEEEIQNIALNEWEGRHRDSKTVAVDLFWHFQKYLQLLNELGSKVQFIGNGVIFLRYGPVIINVHVEGAE